MAHGPDNTSKCNTCRQSIRMEGPKGARVWCAVVSEVVPQPITKCSQYSDARHPTVEEFETKAWNIVIDTESNEFLGIFPPSPEETDLSSDLPEKDRVVGFGQQSDVDAIGFPLPAGPDLDFDDEDDS